MVWILRSFWGAVSFDRNIGESWNLKCIILITFFIQISNKNCEKRSQIENLKIVNYTLPVLYEGVTKFCGDFENIRKCDIGLNLRYRQDFVAPMEI